MTLDGKNYIGKEGMLVKFLESKGLPKEIVRYVIDGQNSSYFDQSSQEIVEKDNEYYAQNGSHTDEYIKFKAEKQKYIEIFSTFLKNAWDEYMD